jgi:hypothetical protein
MCPNNIFCLAIGHGSHDGNKKIRSLMATARQPFPSPAFLLFHSASGERIWHLLFALITPQRAHI